MQRIIAITIKQLHSDLQREVIDEIINLFMWMTIL
jgi:hypothetical protein